MLDQLAGSRPIHSAGEVDGQYQAGFEFIDRTGSVSQTTYSCNNAGTPQPFLYGSRAFDKLGRLGGINWGTGSPVTWHFDKSAYEYDIYGRRTRLVRNDNFDWNYQYDSLNQLNSAKRKLFGPAQTSPFAPGQQFEYRYDTVGNRKEVQFGGDTSGVFTTTNKYGSNYAVNAMNQYTSRTVPNKFDVTGDADITAAATVIQIDGTASAPDYVLNKYFQKRISVDNSAGPGYAEVSILGPNIPLSPPDLHIIPQSPESFTYDARGNLTRDGLYTYTWDAENRLATMADSEKLFTFAYDYMGRRIAKTISKLGEGSGDDDKKLGTSGEPVKGEKGDPVEWLPPGTVFSSTRYVYDGWNLSASYLFPVEDPAKSVDRDRSYAWGPDLSGTEQGAGGIGGLAIFTDHGPESGDTQTGVPIYDGNGNVVSLRDKMTSPLAQYSYGPFGETTSAVGPLWNRNPFRFSTKYTDAETGLVYYGYSKPALRKMRDKPKRVTHRHRRMWMLAPKNCIGF